MRRVYERKGKIVRPFTPEDDAKIEALRIAGWTLKAIGQAVGRRISSVWMRLNYLARRDEEEEA